jgi:hypothetical protein
MNHHSCSKTAQNRRLQPIQAPTGPKEIPDRMYWFSVKRRFVGKANALVPAVFVLV